MDCQRHLGSQLTGYKTLTQLGWHGLIMAKTYLETHGGNGDSLARADSTRLPKILIMDAGQSIGGVWDASRLYPELKTNNAVSTYEFSDFPLLLERYVMGNTGHIPGKVVHQYLSDFAKHFGIAPLIRFSTRVQAADLQHNGTWLVSYCSSSSSSTETSSLGGIQEVHGQLTASKIAVATGLTSEPRVPAFVGQDAFRGEIFHSKELKARERDLASARNIVVVGGNKSAWDACYSAARLGAEQVHMVIRPSGGGPSWVWRPKKMGRFSISRMSSTRLFSWFDPSPLGRSYQLPRNFLRRTWLGQLLSSFFWTVLDFFAFRASGYHDPLVQKLRPWNSTYWMGSSLSIHNYETEWFDLVRSGRINVHHAEIASLNGALVHLTDGDDVEADIIVCCTGWKNESTIKFGPPAIALELGLPGCSPGVHKIELVDAPLIERAFKQVVQQCPELLVKPLRSHRQPAVCQANCSGKEVKRNLDPSPRVARGFHLYRYIVSPSERMLNLRNLAFIGMHQSVHTTMIAQAQALWATAFFDGRVPSLSAKGDECLRYETYCVSEYQRLRRPKKGAGAGGQYLDVVFDMLPYVDSLLEDIGVQTKRKGAWWQEVFQPYTLRDYRGIVREWMDLSC